MIHPLDEWVDHAHVGFKYRNTLETLKTIATNLNLWPKVPVISVAGTNGKGSCVATASYVLQQLGKRVGATFSPHIHDVTERISIDGVPVEKKHLWTVIQFIQQQTHLPLSYFETLILAAMYLFKEAQCDVWVMEVGLGGRLDAVNILDADIAIITSIGLDHQDILGETREAIAQEKLGIARSDKTLIIAEQDWPDVPYNHLANTTYIINRDFKDENGRWIGLKHHVDMQQCSLARPSVMAALTAIEALNLMKDTEINLAELSLPGRFEFKKVHNTIFIFDVAHNDAAIKRLAQQLKGYEKTSLLFSSQIHKCVFQGLCELLNQVESISLIDCKFKNNNDYLYHLLPGHYQRKATITPCLTSHLKQLLQASKPFVVVTGSFMTVAYVQQKLASIVQITN